MQASRAASAGVALQLDGNASTTYLHALIEHNPIAIIVLDSQHRFQLCNPAFLDLFQFEAQELETWGIDSMIAGPDFMLEASQLTERVLSGKRVQTVTKRRRKDGLIIDVALHGVPLIVDGTVIGIYGLYQDVTDRMDATAAIELMTTRLDVAREQERRRFARDLHDSLSQDLALLTWNLRKLAQLVTPQSAMQTLVEQTSELADACVSQIRTSSFLMHPPQLGEADLHTALVWLAEGFERRSGIQITLDLEPLDERLPPDLEAALYRLIQEGLTNVLRHARDSTIVLILSVENDRLHLTLTNSVTSVPPSVSGMSTLHGVGLSSMRERLQEFDGTLRVTSSRAGVQLSVQVPMGRSVLCVS